MNICMSYKHGLNNTMSVAGGVRIWNEGAVNNVYVLGIKDRRCGTCCGETSIVRWGRVQTRDKRYQMHGELP